MASLSLRIYQKTCENKEFSILVENKKTKESLLYQAGTVSSLASSETDAIRSDHYARLADSYGCLGVLQVCPRISWEGEHTQLYLIIVTRCIKVCSLYNSVICKIQEVDIVSLQSMRPPNQRPQEEEPWIRELKKLLGNESFYFSVANNVGEVALDITLCTQRRAKGGLTDNRFFWNRMLHLHPKRFGVNCDKWLIKVMCGSIEFSTLYMNNHTPKVLIISRLSCERAGTRFNVRGVDDAGHVANFVETEQLILVDSLEELVLSYIQIRGTVPLFWEQPGLNVGSHKVTMSREPEVSVQAFRKHMRYIREKYGNQAVLNLLGTGVTGKRQGEAALSHLFQLQHLSCPWSKDCPHVVFDFHQECSKGNTEALQMKLLPQIEKQIEEFSYFSSTKGITQTLQTGVFRTNCLDCLDRTNRVQTFLAIDVLKSMLNVMGVSQNGIIVQRFTTKLEEMVKDSGNKISQIYAGTGALQGSKLIDGARSAARTIQNNLLDNSKQEAIDIMLHGNLLNNYLATLARTLLPYNYLYAPLNVLKHICDRSPSFSEKIPLRVAVGTYNVNGGKHFRSLAYKHLSLDDWLLDSQKNVGKSSLIDTSPSHEEVDDIPPDIFAIGFEEIVDLTATNIVQNTQWSENANSWGRELQKVISRDTKYVMVTWKQLVGVALFVFVNERHACHVRDVAVESVKTGMQGATGNKGGVGIRMVIRNTSMAFVCSHFAAGQKEVNERNADYDSIARKMVFHLGIPLWAHDYVFWCGDFNYRINLARDEVVDLIQRQDWELLLQQDQLKKSQSEMKCFKGFIEGDISFPPTYKYDLFSDDYDTSDKCRIPAWTDRCLFWKRRYNWDKSEDWTPGKIIHYGRAELKQSDHRPVLAIFEVDGRVVIPSGQEATYQSVVQSIGPTDCTVIVQIMNLSPGEDSSSALTDEVLEKVQEEMGFVGSVVLVRFVEEKVLFTFSDSQMALKAAEASPLTIGNLKLEVKLKNEHWFEYLQEELALCGDTTVPLCDLPTRLDETLPEAELNVEKIESMMQEFYPEGPDDEDCNEIEEIAYEKPKPVRPAPPRPQPARPPPPARPTPPNSNQSSPAVTRRAPSVPVEKPQRPDSLFDKKPEMYLRNDVPQSSSMDSEDTSPPLGPPPSFPSDTSSPDDPLRYGSITRPLPILPPRSPGKNLPQVPTRNLPPVPARNLPPVPPRN